jgi:hypothetical protein
MSLDNLSFNFEKITLILVVFFFVPWFTWRGMRAYNNARWGKFIYCLVVSLYVLRLAYLRVSTNGGTVTINDPSNLHFAQELGSPVAFFIFTLAFLVAAIFRVVSDEAFIRKNYVKREHYDALVEQLAALNLKMGESSSNEDE